MKSKKGKQSLSKIEQRPQLCASRNDTGDAKERDSFQKPNVSAALRMRSRTGTEKGQRFSHAPQATQSDA